ncbi:DUF305 domain-containing protein [Trichocoleus sp. FACHB-591]|uniref:DUF305 domain-containing protein n=1 Tax=Trichocoleus sp. FACHB-591 TaxID=2692872 RepID=UPI00168A3F81|nr:DUF305 domain-containing protein [Trichocoleus sp. FACHB-591]MBD2095593.1 DUF305 domain-containing protein [Trichocoleus sp. FACHB-591]
MYRMFRMKTSAIALLLGAIATASLLNACSTPSQNQAQTPNPAATTAGSNQPMNHGNAHHSGTMDHSASIELGPANAEYDLRFVDAMTPHHEGAVAMAKEAQQKSQRPEIQKLAADIIAAQNKEIGALKQWRQAWYPNASAQPVAWNAQMGHAMPMSPDQRKGMAMDMDLGTADAEFDLRFINAMIPHHEGAVTMAQDALSKSKRPEIKQLAQAIIKSQEAEIQQMQQWRQAWYQR